MYGGRTFGELQFIALFGSNDWLYHNVNAECIGRRRSKVQNSKYQLVISENSQRKKAISNALRSLRTSTGRICRATIHLQPWNEAPP